MSTLQLQHLGKTYPDGHEAVLDVDLDIDDGEFFVLVGPSGCGKSTVLRMVAGVEDVTTGTVSIDGVRVNDIGTRTRDVAMVSQTASLYPNMTVADNIGFPLKLAKVDRRTVARRVAEVAAQLELTSVLDRKPRWLSGGQRQRAAMGRAIIRDPRLFLMDEPMSNLDAKLRTQTRHEIADIQRRLGVTTMYVTHDQVEAMALGERVAVMRDGRIVQLGTPMELYQSPNSMFVAQFVGSPPMNLVSARVIGDGESVALRIGSHVVPVDESSKASYGLLRRLIGREVGVGVRAEALRVSPSGPLIASALMIERLGDHHLVYATIDGRSVSTADAPAGVDRPSGTTIVVSTERDLDVSIWKPLPLSVDMDQIHLFDLSTGDAIR